MNHDHGGSAQERDDVIATVIQKRLLDEPLTLAESLHVIEWLRTQNVSPIVGWVARHCSLEFALFVQSNSQRSADASMRRELHAANERARASYGPQHALRRTLGVLLVLCTLLGLSACRTDTPKPSTAPGELSEAERDMSLEVDDGPKRSGDVLVVGVNAETNGWDALSNQFSQSGSLVAGSMMETLGKQEPNGDVAPLLAMTWTASADLRQWTIGLRRGVTYHDGSPFDAANVKANLDERVKRSVTARVGVERNIEHVDVLAPYDVRVSLREPHAQLDVALADLYMESTERLANPAEQQLHPIGTGPFVFDTWVRDQRLTVKKNEHYWRGPAPLDSIVFKPIADEATRAAALRSGDLDAAMSSSASTAASLDHDFKVIRDFTSERTFLMLNQSEGPQNAGNPFTNEHARKALAYATDRARIAALAGDHVQSTPQPNRPGSSSRPETRWALPVGDEGYYAYDVDKAKAEVELYKRETGRASLTFDVLLSGSDGREQLTAAQDMWHEAGIDAQLRDVDQATLIILVFTGQYQATGWRWFGAPNPESNTPFVDARETKPIGDLSLNLSRSKSPLVADRLRALQTSGDFEERRAAANDVWREINRSATLIWLYDTPWSFAASERVHGLNAWRSNPLGFRPKPGWFADVWLDAR